MSFKVLIPHSGDRTGLFLSLFSLSPSYRELIVGKDAGSF